VDEHLEERDKVLELAARMAAEDVQLYYQIGLIGRRDLPLAPDLRGGLEMVLLRMLAFRPAVAGQAEAPARAVPATTGKPATGPGGKTEQTAPQAVAQPAAASVPVTASIDAEWPALIEVMQLKGMLRELAMNCSVQSRQDDCWQLVLDSNHRQLFSKERLQRLEKSLCDCLQVKLRLELDTERSADDTPAEQQRHSDEERQANAVTAITDDPNVKAIQKAFDATLHTESIRPVDT